MTESEFEKMVEQIGFVPDGITVNEIEQVLKSETTNAIFYKSNSAFWWKALEDIKRNSVCGDVVQCGVWKGGTACLLKFVMNKIELQKELWLADFYGKNVSIKIDEEHTKDKKSLELAAKFKITPPDKNFVENNFRKFGVWDNRIHFLVGDVADTLPMASVAEISLLHADVDFYKPTLNVLQSLYSKVSPGGYIVIDDYGVDSLNCKDAVDKFRSENEVTEPLHFVGPYTAFWIKRNCEK